MKMGIVLTTSIGLILSTLASAQDHLRLKPGAVGAQSGRIGVITTTVPTPDTELSGAWCLLCRVAASAANSSLSDHAKKLSTEDIPKIETDLIKALQANGSDVVAISESLDMDSLADRRARGDTAEKNFTPLKAKYKVDKLLVVQVDAVGFARSYAAYVPTSNPKGMYRGAAYIIDLDTNAYLWYRPVTVTKEPTDNWDEAPDFPNLTNSYYQAINEARTQLISSLTHPETDKMEDDDDDEDQQPAKPPTPRVTPPEHGNG